MYEVIAGQEDVAHLSVVEWTEMGAVFEPGEAEALAELVGPEWDRVEELIELADVELAAAARTVENALVDEVLEAFDQQLDLDERIEALPVPAPRSVDSVRRQRRQVASVMRGVA